MKKVMVVFVFAILLIGILGFVHADSDNGVNGDGNGNLEVTNKLPEGSLKVSGNDSFEKEDKENENESEVNSHMEDNDENESEVETHSNYQFTDENGKEYQIEIKTKTKMKNGKKGESEQEIEFHGYNFSSALKVHFRNEGNESKLKVNLSNGEEREVKVLPDVASQNAIDVFRSRNITVELKEVGDGTNKEVVYEADGEKEVKLFGFIKVQAKLKARVDSNTGEVSDFEKPWWSFLVTSEDLNVSASN